MSTPTPPLRRRNLAQDVADHLREGILTGRYRPGSRLDHDAIVAELGVSRLPMREAVIAPDQDGWCGRRRGAGPSCSR